MTGREVTLGAPTHYLKIESCYFDAVVNNDKRAEVRRHDRDFWVNDVLHLKEWTGDDYTGRVAVCVVTHILPGGHHGIDDDYCVLSINLIEELYA